MARKMPDSTVAKQWIRNIWHKQASRPMPPAPNQKIARSLGIVEVDRTRSMTASMHRKKYMGWCRLRSTLTTAKMVMFPTTATKYMEPKGMESQMCRCSNPGMPVSQKELGTEQALLEMSMLGSMGYAEELLRSGFCSCETGCLLQFWNRSSFPFLVTCGTYERKNSEW